jgi:hypothetical protein
MAKMVPADIVAASEQPPVISTDDRIRIKIVPLFESVENTFVQIVPDVITRVSRVRGDVWEDAVVDMFMITHPVARRYLPSRVYWDENEDCFCLLYYTNPAINTPRFAGEDETVYAFAIALDPEVELMYDMHARVFIDQIKIGTKMFCLFFFGDRDYPLLVQPHVVVDDVK